jgi:hypothetical protein
MSQSIRRWPVVLCLAAAVLVLLSHAWADPWGSGPTHFRAGVLPAPLGSYVDDWHSAQAAAADVDRFVVYRHEWFQGGKTLGPYGRHHVQQIARRLLTSGAPFPVVIQPDLQDEKLNAARQTEIVNLLLAAGIPDALDRVILAFPQAEGLYGDAAPRIFLQQIQGGRTGFGGLGGAGGVGTGGAGTGGLPSGGGMGSFGGGFGGGFRGYREG